MIKKINFYHSIIFFNLCIFISAFDFLRNNHLIILCLFLILTIGIAHGSLDNIKGKKILKIYDVKSMSTFYIGYSLISLSIILFWIIFPKTLLFIFIIIASYHFGKEDTNFIKKEKNVYDNFLFFFKGLPVIVSPLLFHKIETIIIFQSLNFNISGIIFIENIFLYFLLFLCFFSNLLLFYKNDIISFINGFFFNTNFKLFFESFICIYNILLFFTFNEAFLNINVRIKQKYKKRFFFIY